MTDKVQKIRAFLVGIADTDGVSTILARAIEKKILPYIDSLQKEPVSEDLEKEIQTTIKMVKHLDLSIDDIVSFCAHHYSKWQKEQFEKNRLAACDKQTEEEAEIEQSFLMGIIECEHRQPTFDDAIKYGMRLQRENMMKDAVDAVAHIEAGNYPYIPQLELYDYDKDIPLAKEGDKYKVVLIKED